MSKLLIFIIALLLLGCGKNTALTHKTKNVQACLDLLLLHQKENYKDLENHQLILTKDNQTSDLMNLHYGKNKIILQDVLPRTKSYYYSQSADTTKVYTKISYIIVDRNTINVNWELLNGNQVIMFELKRKNDNWQPVIKEMRMY